VEKDKTSQTGNFKEEYRRYTRKKVFFIISCLITAFLALGLSIYVGATDIGFFRIYEIIIDHVAGVTYTSGTPDFLDDYIVCNVRLPRAIFALIAGAGLAVGGAVMQSVMRNPLADPYTTGISSGACLGVAVAIILGLSISGTQFGDLGVIVNSFLFAMIPMMIIILIAPRSAYSPATLILAGVAISYILNALTTILMVSTDSETLSIVYRWQIGSLASITWSSVLIMATVNLIGIAVTILLSKKLNILALGEENAKSLGLNVEGMRLLCLMIISFMVASVVCYAGIIGFIGLISAHIVRMLIDSDNRFVIPASAVFGAVFLLGADIIARYLSPSDSIPVGVILSFVGAPIFLYLIIKQKKTLW
jgi:iron complex transport system permease protein